MASIWLGDLYREASLSTKWTCENNIKLLVISLHNGHLSSTLTLSAKFKKQEGLQQLKCREAELYSQKKDLQLYRERRESKMEMLSVPLSFQQLQSNRQAGMQEALWIRSGYKRQSKLLVQSDSFHHPRRWRVKSLCNILSHSRTLSLSLEDTFGWEHHRCWLFFCCCFLFYSNILLCQVEWTKRLG